MMSTRKKYELVYRIFGQLHLCILDSLQHIHEANTMHIRHELNMKVGNLANNATNLSQCILIQSGGQPTTCWIP